MKLNKLIRLLGVLAGALGVSVAIYVLISDVERRGLVGPLSMLLISFVFLVYGIGGKKLLGKFLPGATRSAGE